MNALMAARRRLRVAAPSRARTRCVEEAEDQGRVELLDLQLRRLCPGAFGGEGKQQTEAVRIGFAAMRAIAALAGHVIAQIAGDQGARSVIGRPLRSTLRPRPRYRSSAPVSPEYLYAGLTAAEPSDHLCRDATHEGGAFRAA